MRYHLSCWCLLVKLDIANAALENFHLNGVVAVSLATVDRSRKCYLYRNSFYDTHSAKFHSYGSEDYYFQPSLYFSIFIFISVANANLLGWPLLNPDQMTTTYLQSRSYNSTIWSTVTIEFVVASRRYYFPCYLQSFWRRTNAAISVISSSFNAAKLASFT